LGGVLAHAELGPHPRQEIAVPKRCFLLKQFLASLDDQVMESTPNPLRSGPRGCGDKTARLAVTPNRAVLKIEAKIPTNRRDRSGWSCGEEGREGACDMAPRCGLG